MKDLWRVLGESWPLAWPRAELRREIGDEAVETAERAGLLRQAPLFAGDPYPCQCPAKTGCGRRLVDEDGLVAVCELAPAQCLAEPLAPEDAVRCHVDAEGLVALLQRALRVPVAPPKAHAATYPVGVRRVGSVEARLLLVPRPAPWFRDGGLDRAARDDPDRVLVAFVFDRQALPDGAPRRVEGARVAWVPLSEALSLDGPMLDLADLWLSVAPGEDVTAELWPRYAFTADPARGRFTYAGRPLPLDRRPLESRLLAELLRRAGDWVPRRDLLLALWPEEFSSRTMQPIEPVALDRRLRQLRSALSATFLELPEVTGVARDPVESLRTRSDLEGGLRVAVEARRVWWASGTVRS